jgi:hypothetical protein
MPAPRSRPACWRSSSPMMATDRKYKATFHASDPHRSRPRPPPRPRRTPGSCVPPRMPPPPSGAACSPAMPGGAGLDWTGPAAGGHWRPCDRRVGTDRQLSATSGRAPADLRGAECADAAPQLGGRLQRECYTHCKGNATGSTG